MSKRWKGEVPVSENKRFEKGSVEHEEYKARQRAHYEKTKIHQREKARKRIAKKRLRNQQFIVNVLASGKCEHCGIGDLRVLAFDHIEPNTKFANIADLVSRGAKLKYIKEEITKCRILCHNCHMLVTMKQAECSYKTELSPMNDEEFDAFVKELGV